MATGRSPRTMAKGAKSHPKIRRAESLLRRRHAAVKCWGMFPRSVIEKRLRELGASWLAERATRCDRLLSYLSMMFMACGYSYSADVQPIASGKDPGPVGLVKNPHRHWTASSTGESAIVVATTITALEAYEQTLRKLERVGLDIFELRRVLAYAGRVGQSVEAQVSFAFDPGEFGRVLRGGDPLPATVLDSGEEAHQGNPYETIKTGLEKITEWIEGAIQAIKHDRRRGHARKGGRPRHLEYLYSAGAVACLESLGERRGKALKEVSSLLSSLQGSTLDRPAAMKNSTALISQYLRR